MPTYDYQCAACDHEFECFQSISSPVKRKCPACGQLKLKRLIGPGAAIVFKGSGFYQTDYRSESYKKRASEEKKAASPSTSESKAESNGGDAKAKSSAKDTAKDTSASDAAKNSADG